MFVIKAYMLIYSLPFISITVINCNNGEKHIKLNKMSIVIILYMYLRFLST